MKHIKNIELAKKYFNFLTAIFHFRVEDIENHNHALYAKFVSSSVGIYFIYEFRDLVPQIQFTKLNGGVLKVRKSLYTIRELDKNDNFKLHSFYLDEILSFKGQTDYKSYFKNVKTIEEAINISSELVRTYAMDYVKGNELSYVEIDKWYRAQLNKNIE